MSKAVVFDIAHRFLKRMLSDEQDRSPDYYARLAYELDISPKLLQFNPALNRSINGLGGGATLNHVLDWSIRDWLEYHHNYIDQGYRYGTAHLQQVWMGRPILKTPLDCWMYQEIIHSVKPDIIIELGVKFGGSSLFIANLMDIMGQGEVLGVDIDLSNVQDLQHPRITFLEGSSTDPEIVTEVHSRVNGKSAMVIADSDHEFSHVLTELNSYCDLVSVGSYFIVEDGIADLMNWMPVPVEGPLVASTTFLESHSEFESDREIAEKYLITINPDGYLLRTK